MKVMEQVTKYELRLHKEKVLGAISGSTDAMVWARKLLGEYAQEVMLMMLLNIKHDLIGYAIVSMGGITYTQMDMRVMGPIAIMGGATAVIMAHNHPTGHVMPSQEDITATQRLAVGFSFLQITMLDHIIVSDTDAYSFAEHMPRLLDTKETLEKLEVTHE